jgi:hypothetical protein
MPAMRVFPLKRKASGSRYGHLVATIIGLEKLATVYPGYLRRRPNPNHRVNSKPETVWPPPKRGQAKTLIKKTGTGENAHLGAPCARKLNDWCTWVDGREGHVAVVEQAELAGVGDRRKD